MLYTQLGETDINISKICVGCMSFGKPGTMHDWTLDEEENGRGGCSRTGSGHHFLRYGQRLLGWDQ